MIRVKRIVMKSSRVLLKNGLEKKIRSQSCKPCDATIKFSLGLHMRKVHQGELHFLKRNITAADLRFKCSENGCSKSFESENCLKLHKGNHDRTYPCLFCAEELEGKENWEEHCTTCS